MILGMAVAVPLMLSSDQFKPKLESHLTESFGRPVLIGQLSLKLLPPSFDLQGVTIAQAQGRRTPWLQADTVKVRLAWSSLWAWTPVIQSVTVSGATLTLERGVDGAWGWQEGWSGATRSMSASQKSLSQVVFENVNVSMMDPAIPARLEARGLSGTYDGTPPHFSLQGDLEGLATPLRLRLDGPSLTLSDGPRQLTWTRQSDRLTGASAEWMWGNAWPLVQMALRIPGKPSDDGAARLLKDWAVDATASADRWTWTQRGTLGAGSFEMKGEFRGGAIQGALGMKGIPAEAMPDAHGFGGTLFGAVTGLVDFAVVASTAGRAVQSARATIEISQGHYRFPEPALASVKKAKTLAYLRKKHPALDAKGLAFAALRISGTAAGSMFTVEGARLDAGDLRAAATGTFDIPKGGLDLTIRIDLREKNPALRSMIPGRYITGASGRETIRPIFGRLQGTPAEWFIKSVPSSKVPAAAQKQLQRSITTK